MEDHNLDGKSINDSNKNTTVSRIEYMKMVDLNNSLIKEIRNLKRINDSYKGMLKKVTETRITGTSMASVVIRNLIKQIKTLLEK